MSFNCHVIKYEVHHKFVVNADGTKSYINTFRCIGDAGQRVGEIAFYKDKIPDSYITTKDTFTNGSYFYLNYEIDRYQDIIETFRYEKPINIEIDRGAEKGPNENFIRKADVFTREEPSGEQEGQGAPWV